MQIGFGDFDVEAEHLVEANLERGDAGALAFALFHGGDDLAAVLAQVAQFVEFGVEAAANDAGIGGQRRRIVGEGFFEALVHVGQFVDFAEERIGAGRCHCWRRRLRNRRSSGIARAIGAERRDRAEWHAERGAAGQALEILHAASFGESPRAAWLLRRVRRRHRGAPRFPRDRSRDAESRRAAGARPCWWRSRRWRRARTWCDVRSAARRRHIRARPVRGCGRSRVEHQRVLLLVIAAAYPDGT